NLAIQYDDLVNVNVQGIEVNVVNGGGFKAGPSIGFNFGRDEDGSNPLGLLDATDELIGLGDVDFTIEAGGFVQYSTGQFSGKVAVRQGVNGHEGLVGEAELKYNSTFSAFGQTGFFSVGPEISYGDDAFNSAFFDIAPAQSVASGISEFDADGGLNSVGLGASVLLPLGNNFSLVGFAGYDRLIGDIADSSLVQERGSENQATLGIFIGYTF
ncbi:MAG: MipA/OmpV family protein, partial [Pseudomonadota bacterium]